MSKTWIITVRKEQVISMLMDDGQPVEIHCSSLAKEEVLFSLGDIYIGRVKKILPNIQAAFIEIAPGVEGYYSLEKNIDPIFTRSQSTKKICIGDELVVQIQKEAVKTKGMTLSSNLNFQGKYLLLTTGNNKIGVSTKIEKERRGELQAIVKTFASKNYGFVVRTNTRNATEKQLRDEAQLLVEKYIELSHIANKRTCYSCLQKASPSYVTDLRNVYQDDLSKIIVEDKNIYKQIEEYLRNYQPEDLEKLNLYEDMQLSLDKLYAVEKHLERALKEKVWLSSGAYLVIQPTEALTVIDVNTGKASGKKEAYLKYNLEAAKECARQIRLRNLSGIILIDFINLKEKEELEMLLTTLRKYLKEDPISTTLVDVTKLNLVEITRKKVRKPLAEYFGNKNS